MKHLSIVVTGFSLLLVGACTRDVRTSETNKQEVKEIVKINTEDGGDVKVWTLGADNTVETQTVVQAVEQIPTDRDAYLSKMESELRDLATRVESLRDRAGMRAKYNTGRNELRREINRLEGQIGDARRDLATMRAKTDADFARDRARLDNKVAAIRADVDRAVAE